MVSRLFLAFIAAAFAGSVAYAAAPSDTGNPQQTDAPKDCKKNPTDPRCKDEDKKS